jgi:UMF1 family MFS transporter
MHMSDLYEARDSNYASRSGLICWALYDWANSAFHTIILTFVFAAYFTRAVAPDELEGSRIWGTVIGIGGLVIAILGPILGATTDQTGRRKPWIAVFTAWCVIATGLLWFIRPDPSFVWTGVLLVALAEFGIELAIVFYNAMLPAIVSEDRVGRWSGWGWSLGYAGGLASLAVVLVLFVNEKHMILPFDTDQSEQIRASFVLVAAWIALFSIPFFIFTPDSPASGKSLGRGLRDGLAQIKVSLVNVRHYADIVRFLVAHMLYADGLATLFAFGGVYAAGTFNLDEQQILLFGIGLNVTAGLGALGFSWVDDRIGSKRTILLSLVGLIVCGASILFASNVTLFWVGGLILGIFVGPAQAASRSYLARVVPKHLENQFFGLFALSGKATAFVGPLTVGWVTYLAGSQRIGMSIIIVFWIVGFALLWSLPHATPPASMKHA